jgi:hypothetical protein
MIRTLPILIVLASTALASAQTPKKIASTEADLPRFNYPVDGDAQQLLNMRTFSGSPPLSAQMSIARCAITTFKTMRPIASCCRRG